MDSFIDEVVAIADAEAARRRSSKRLMLSFDEWNVWYRTRGKREGRTVPGWPVAPPILEEIYTMKTRSLSAAPASRCSTMPIACGVGAWPSSSTPSRRS